MALWVYGHYCADTKQDYMPSILVENDTEVIAEYMLHGCAGIWVQCGSSVTSVSSLSSMGTVSSVPSVCPVRPVCDQGTVAIGSKHDPISSTAPGGYFPRNLENLHVYRVKISGAHMLAVRAGKKHSTWMRTVQSSHISDPTLTRIYGGCLTTWKPGWDLRCTCLFIKGSVWKTCKTFIKLK